MKIILYQPQIPQNTGNIVRTCNVTGASLGLVTPLGFSVSNRWLKRAGLDYWEGVEVSFIDDLEAYIKTAPASIYLFSSKAKKRYCDVHYTAEDWLIFGSETTGLPTNIVDAYPDQCLTLPMQTGARCLNLATTAGIAIYEAWRQLGFEPLKS